MSEAPPHPAPGDLYVLPASAEQGVEWLVVDSDPSGAHRLLVVADTRPEAGSDDVELFDDDPAGPLVFRTAHGIWVAAGLLTPELQTRSVPDTVVERVRNARRRPEEGSTVGIVARETDRSASYRDWIDTVVRPAVAAVAAAQQPETGPPGPSGAPPTAPMTSVTPVTPVTPVAPVDPSPPTRSRSVDDTGSTTVVRRRPPGGPRSPSWLYPLAAVLALAVLGLGWYTVQLRQTTERLSEDRDRWRRIADGRLFSEYTEPTEVPFDIRRSGSPIYLGSGRVLGLVLPRDARLEQVRFRLLDTETGEALAVLDVATPSRSGGLLDLSPLGLADGAEVELVLEIPDPAGGEPEVFRRTLVLGDAPEGAS